MSSTQCTNCGAAHDIESTSDDFGSEDETYVMYTCPENGTTYGQLLNVGEIDE